MVRITHVLCPIDFSEFSRHAFDRALAIARRHSAKITALHIFPTPSVMPAGAVPFGPEGPGPFALHHLDQEQPAQELAEFLPSEPSLGVPVEFKVLESRTVFREILHQADDLSADLVVMGTHGRSGLDRLLLGSVTEKVLRRPAYRSSPYLHGHLTRHQPRLFRSGESCAAWIFPTRRERVSTMHPRSPRKPMLV